MTLDTDDGVDGNGNYDERKDCDGNNNHDDGRAAAAADDMITRTLMTMMMTLMTISMARRVKAK